MAYDKKTWESGEKIRTSALNNMEEGIATNDEEVTKLDESTEKMDSDLSDLMDKAVNKNDAGSSFTATVNTGGYLTSSNTNVLFMIAITDKDRTIDSITCNNTQIRQNGYLTGSSNGSDSFPAGGSVTFSQTALGTRVTLVFPSSIGGTNNDAVGVCVSLTIKFKS